MEAVIAKNHETKAKNNLYNFKGPGPGKFLYNFDSLNVENFSFLCFNEFQ